MSFPFAIYVTKSTTDTQAKYLPTISASGANTYYSEVWSGNDSDGYSTTVFYTGTLTGAFTLWGSDKPYPDLSNDNDWIQDTNFVPTNPAGVAGKFGDDASNCKKFHKRLKYVNASGAGTIEAYVNIIKVV